MKQKGAGEASNLIILSNTILTIPTQFILLLLKYSQLDAPQPI